MKEGFQTLDLDNLPSEGEEELTLGQRVAQDRNIDIEEREIEVPEEIEVTEDDHDDEETEDESETTSDEEDRSNRSGGNRRSSRAQKRIKQLVGEKKEIESLLEKERQERQKLQEQFKKERTQFVSRQKQDLEGRLATLQEQEDNAITTNDTAMALRLSRQISEVQGQIQSLGTVDLDDEYTEETTQAPAQQQAPWRDRDRAAEMANRWAERNSWMNDAEAYPDHVDILTEISEELVQEGHRLDTRAYYRELDLALQEAFEQEGLEMPNTSTKEAPRRQRAAPAAATKRGQTTTKPKGNTVRLTKQDLAAAALLDISPEEYARQKKARTNSEGKYVTNQWSEIVL